MGELIASSGALETSPGAWVQLDGLTDALVRIDGAVRAVVMPAATATATVGLAFVAGVAWKLWGPGRYLATASLFLMNPSGDPALGWLLLPWLREGCSQILSEVLLLGLLAPLTYAAVRGLRRRFPGVRRTTWVALGALPFLWYAPELLEGIGHMGDLLRAIGPGTPVGALRTMLAVGLLGAGLTPHLAAAYLGSSPGRGRPGLPAGQERRAMISTAERVP